MTAAVVLASATVATATAMPAKRPGSTAAAVCEPDAQRTAVGAAMARLDRVDDQPSYTARQLRRIDRRLDRALADKQQAGASTGRLGLNLRIPVAVHVIDGRRARGPSRYAVARQLEVRNRAYDGGQSAHNARTRFRFYEDSFDRTRNQRWYTAALFDDADRELRRRLHRGGPETLNLYFSAPQSPQAESVVLGWSTVPWLAARNPRLDGVTVHQESMPGGDLQQYNRGDTAVHEVGHWLGLLHTFEGGCSAGNDRVADTPAEAEPSLTCETGRDTCESEGLDPIRNFMNYSFDSCMNMFTPGQGARMTDNWLADRTP